MSDDNTSQANFHHIASTNLDFEWTIDFDAKLISGSVKHTLEARQDGVKEVVYVAHFCWARIAFADRCGLASTRLR